MTLRYRTMGSNRHWIAETWTDVESTFGVARDGDSMRYVQGLVDLIRLNSKWIPVDSKRWGKNDASTVPSGSLSSEGVWSVTGDVTFTSGYLGKYLDVLAVKISVVPGSCTFSVSADTDAKGSLGRPAFLGIRCIYFSTNKNVIMDVTGRGFRGGLKGSGNTDTPVSGFLIAGAGGDGGAEQDLRAGGLVSIANKTNVYGHWGDYEEAGIA